MGVPKLSRRVAAEVISELSDNAPTAPIPDADFAELCVKGVDQARTAWTAAEKVLHSWRRRTKAA
ncbi:MAG: hypothetical protein WB801_05390 [Candidatus Dormiibacterota bacterium]